MLNNKELLKKIGFSPKENESEIFYKKFPILGNYILEVDFKKEKFNFGSKIKSDSSTTQNFSQEENWIVLECVNRLLEKGYKPEDITLEKTFPSGHGHSGRLDIFVEKEGKAFLMIECKTFGKEFEKEFKNIEKNGGQLFTYFQNDTNTEILMLYTSHSIGNKIDFNCEIIKIESNYRSAGKVEDVFNRWNKITNQNGIFEDWVTPYFYENKLITKKELKPLKESDSGFIFHRFLSILRKYSVSDKPNAFNKIFNLFLAKIYDEKKRENDELDFQWKENIDNAVDFQIRLINLYQQGMYEFLKKEVEGISDKDFNYKTIEELQEKKKKWLKFNNVFAIKEVIDDESFEDNQKVLKEVVELLQRYQIRYPRRQQHLSNFFERLLTTGLKQESGQFFTPPPITKFIIKSLPIKQFIEKDLNQPVAKLPAVIDYACGSGHFITEVMEQYQDIINKLDTTSYYEDGIDFIKTSQIKPYDWAAKYVYGIEKDYRLVKVAKVGCYFYGDGLAQIIHGDGLDNFKSSKNYIGLLKENVDDIEKAKFSFVVSNPPYSVAAFKGDIKNDNVSDDFSLYKNLTDNSSEIECLFVERTKQLLKEGGIAAIVLPSSILSNTGIYTKTREIILENFDIVSIVELGNNTFMATNTNTATFFLRRRNNQNNLKIKISVDKFFTNLQDVTLNSIEKPITKYVSHVWEGLSFIDYISLLEMKPNKKVLGHEIFIEYKKKIKTKNEKGFWSILLEKEKEKLYYFIISYDQKVVLIKSGEKNEEKHFLGYEFSNRKGSEGIHPIQRGKTIEECTKLFDVETFDNPEKASTYIYKAFQGDFDFSIAENLQKNISRHNLIDMLTFDRIDFEKTISLSLKKKIKIESKWEIKKLGKVATISYGTRIVKKNEQGQKYPVYGGGNETFKSDSFNRENCYVISRFGMSSECVRFISGKFFLNDSGMTIDSFNINVLDKKYLNYYLFLNQNIIYLCGRGVAQKNIEIDAFNSIQIPLPPKETQGKIVNSIEILEDKENKTIEELNKLKSEISKLIESLKDNKMERLENLTFIGSGGTPSVKILKYWENGIIPWLKSEVCKEGFVYKTDDFITELGLQKSNAKYFEPNTTLIALVGATKGKTAFLKFKATTNQNIAGIASLDENNILNKYIFYVLKGMYSEIIKDLSQYDMLNLTMIKNIKIPIPSIKEQKKVVKEIEEIENQILNLNKKIKEIKNQKLGIFKKYL